MPMEATSDRTTDVPEGILQARTAFLRDFERLYSDRKTREQFVCYHRQDLVAVTPEYGSMIRELSNRGIPEDAYLIFKVTPAEQSEERAFADQANEPA